MFLSSTLIELSLALSLNLKSISDRSISNKTETLIDTKFLSSTLMLVEVAAKNRLRQKHQQIEVKLLFFIQET